MTDSKAPALKEMFDAQRFRSIADEVTAIYPAFDAKRFLAHSLPGLDGLTLMQRLRRMTESLRVTLPSNYRKALGILRRLAPRIDRSFITLVLPDYVDRMNSRFRWMRSNFSPASDLPSSRYGNFCDVICYAHSL